MKTVAGTFIFLALSCGSAAHALTASVSTALSSNYQINDLEADYSVAGFQLQFDVLMSGSAGAESGSSYWGLGFDLGLFSGEMEDPEGVTRSLSEEIDFLLLDPKVFWGYRWGSLDFRIPFVLLSYIKETSGLNENDEKYGYGVGLLVNYQVLPSFNIFSGYQYKYFGHGKNDSTGNSGSLASPANMSLVTLGLGYTFGEFSGGAGGD